jgi:hypothetical protein
MLLVVGLVTSLIPIFIHTDATQMSLRTVWENPYTLTTYHPDNQINSTIYTFPKVIWNGSQYVDYLLNSSEMSAGIGSAYIKVCNDHTVFYDPYQTEERIEAETWAVESCHAPTFMWETEKPVEETVHSLVNSSGIYFERITALDSGSSLEEWYRLEIGAQLKISVILHPAQSGTYRLIWLLSGVSCSRARLGPATENITSQIVDDKCCSSVLFFIENESKCLVDWSDAAFFNDTTQKLETPFQEFRMEEDASDNRSQAAISFGNYSVKNGECLVLDPSIMTFNCTNANSGVIEKLGTTYPPSDTTYVTPYSDGLMIGQDSNVAYYFLYRSYISFDTSSIPALAYNFSATLRLMTHYGAAPFRYFNVQVWGGNQPVCVDNLTFTEGTQPIYGDNLTADSWNAGKVRLATWNTSNYPGPNVYVNFTIPSNQINKAGKTQFELNSSNDGTSVPWFGYPETVEFYSGNSTGKEPKLEVSYNLDTVNLNGVSWAYRNVSMSKAIIVLFGGWSADTYVTVSCIDDPLNKGFGKMSFLDALVQNGFSVFTIQSNILYTNTSTWVQDLTLWLTSQTYSNIYILGNSFGNFRREVVVG